jgi:hypothetical protein
VLPKKKAAYVFFSQMFFPVQVHGDSKMAFLHGPLGELSFALIHGPHRRFPYPLGPLWELSFVVCGYGKKKLLNQIWFGGRNE